MAQKIYVELFSFILISINLLKNNSRSSVSTAPFKIKNRKYMLYDNLYVTNTGTLWLKSLWLQFLGTHNSETSLK